MSKKQAYSFHYLNSKAKTNLFRNAPHYSPLDSCIYLALRMCHCWCMQGNIQLKNVKYIDYFKIQISFQIIKIVIR